MDYEKAYKEALERAKKLTSDMTTLQKIREFIFPELKESEDERIGDIIYRIIRDKKEVKRILEGNGVSVDNALAYLEKQKEQRYKNESVLRITGLSGGEYLLYNYIYSFCAGEGISMSNTKGDLRGYVELYYPELKETIIKEQKSAERIEDSVKFEEGFKAGARIMLHLIIDYFESTKIPMKINTHDKVVDFKEIAEWLKSLRPQSHWKPSKEQMEALNEAVGDYNAEETASCEKTADILESLYNDLEKL